MYVEYFLKRSVLYSGLNGIIFTQHQYARDQLAMSDAAKCSLIIFTGF